MPTDCPTELQLDREVFGKATVDIVVVVSRTQCRSISSLMVCDSSDSSHLNMSQQSQQI